jgi:hypothetical protein
MVNLRIYIRNMSDMAQLCRIYLSSVVYVCVRGAKTTGPIEKNNWSGFQTFPLSTLQFCNYCKLQLAVSRFCNCNGQLATLDC